MTFAFLIDSVPFTRAVIAGETSLGGSESAGLGLARALKTRGHDVHVFTTQLAPDCAGRADHAGVVWHPIDDFTPMNQFIEWDVVCALRMISAFAWNPVFARLRLLWNQDLLVPGQMQNSLMAIAWAVDHLCYVSEYHRAQWEHLQPELKPLGWVTRNGFDPADLPAASTKDPNRIIHISRPERGLAPLLAMWPALRAQNPHATLRLCRYSSMYDQGQGSWSDVCHSFDARVQEVNAQVGGITYLGELNKTQLYQEISDAAVMWYPGVASFAETSCIAALEAQACGTPFVGSYRGALPETVPTGVLIRGNAEKDQVYQDASIAAVLAQLEACREQTFDYRRLQRDGRTHAKQFTYALLAEQWEQQIEAWFSERYETHKPRVLEQLLHEDDHVAARLVAAELDDQKAFDFCDYVIAGKDQTSEHYASAAIQDPLKEVEFSGRFRDVIPRFEQCTRVLDVACGNGSFAIALARTYPHLHVYGLDYAAHNIEIAAEAAGRAGVADRCHFERRTVYDFDAQATHADWCTFAAPDEGQGSTGPELFDGLFVGEFVEHVGQCSLLIDSLETVLAEGARVVYTCPHGACAEMIPRGVPLRRGHVHRFHFDDLSAVWGSKENFAAAYFVGGVTERGNPIGNWIISYTAAADRPAGHRRLADRIRRTRPLQKLSVGLIAKDAENDIGRCLSSVYKIADELIVGDTGSHDATKAIAESYGARVLDLASVFDQPEGFAGARNQVLQAASGDWFLWIDTDEQLISYPWLRRYLDGLVYNGFVIRQRHLYLDGPPTDDIPVRLLRNTGHVKFYGCVHEQPQDGECNQDIYPTLDVADLRMAHFGYLTQNGREEKRVERNLPLLLKDAQVFPNRLLGRVLMLREAVIQSDAHAANGLVDKAKQGYAHALKLFIEHFDDPSHKYHKLARPWYEAALKHLGLGWEWEVALAGNPGGMGDRHAQLERLWVRDGGECARWLTFKAGEIAKGMMPVTFVTDPDELRAPVVVADAAVEPARVSA